MESRNEKDSFDLPSFTEEMFGENGCTNLSPLNCRNENRNENVNFQHFMTKFLQVNLRLF